MPTTLDLSDDTTPEEIQEYVDGVVADINDSHDKPVIKPDSQRLAEDGDEPVTQPTAAGDKPGSDDDPPAKGEAGDWVTDDLKAEVAAYGIGEEELAEFTSREELDRALRLFDRTALEAGRKAMAEGEDGKRSRDELGRYTKKEPEGESEKKEETKGEPKEGRYEIKLDEDTWGEDLIGELTQMRDHYESRISALEARDAEREIAAEEQRFDGLVDSLGHADLFGKAGKETKKELDRRKELFIQAKAQQIGLEHLGRPAKLDASLLTRVARMVFAEEFSKKDIKARTKRLSDQSNRRQGGAAAKGSPESPMTLKEEMRQLYDELDGRAN